MSRTFVNDSLPAAPEWQASSSAPGGSSTACPTQASFCGRATRMSTIRLLLLKPRVPKACGSLPALHSGRCMRRARGCDSACRVSRMQRSIGCLLVRPSWRDGHRRHWQRMRQPTPRARSRRREIVFCCFGAPTTQPLSTLCCLVTLDADQYLALGLLGAHPIGDAHPLSRLEILVVLE